MPRRDRFDLMRANRAAGLLRADPEALRLQLQRRIDAVEERIAAREDAVWADQREKAGVMSLAELKEGVLALHRPEPDPDLDSVVAQARELDAQRRIASIKPRRRWWWPIGRAA